MPASKRLSGVARNSQLTCRGSSASVSFGYSGYFSSMIAGSFMEDGILSARQVDEARDFVNRLLKEVLPDAVGLTDAWDFTDASLSSAIGRRDGDAYATLMRWTEQLPINVKARADGGRHLEAWTQFIQPTLKSKL